MCLFKSRRQYRVTELTQTFNDHRYNQCSFVYNGSQYYGEGKPIVGFQRIMTRKRYVWTVYTNDHHQLFTFATNYANEPINTRKLSKWMREFLNNTQPG